MNWRRYKEVNKKYWFPLLLGLIGTIMNAIINPLYSYIYSSVLNVFNKKGDSLLNKGNYWSLMFLILGLISFCRL